MKNHQHQLSQKLSEELAAAALTCRKYIVDMLTPAKSSHLGCSFSIIDILVVLYHRILDIEKIKTQDRTRDYFLLSKGHGAAALYAVLASVDLIASEELKKYHHPDSALAGHPTRDLTKGIEASTGSLGHGLSMGVGLALAAQHDQRPSKVYVLVGDGESQEGSIWEAVAMATRFALDNLIIIVDYNNLQGLDRTDDIMPNLAEKFVAFGCHVTTIDGHCHQTLLSTFKTLANTGKPSVIIAKTIKGKGIAFIQDKLEWHYRSFNPEQHDIALKELENS